MTGACMQSTGIARQAGWRVRLWSTIWQSGLWVGTIDRQGVTRTGAPANTRDGSAIQSAGNDFRGWSDPRMVDFRDLVRSSYSDQQCGVHSAPLQGGVSCLHGYTGAKAKADAVGCLQSGAPTGRAEDPGAGSRDVSPWRDYPGLFLRIHYSGADFSRPAGAGWETSARL